MVVHVVQRSENRGNSGIESSFGIRQNRRSDVRFRVTEFIKGDR